jgi:hypothetical protein
MNGRRIERPSDERGGEVQTSLLLACDAVLIGRRTYESFAPAWQARSGDPLSDRMNTMPKYVGSTTLTDPEWANDDLDPSRSTPTTARRRRSARDDALCLREVGTGALNETAPTGQCHLSREPAVVRSQIEDDEWDLACGAVERGGDRGRLFGDVG